MMPNFKANWPAPKNIHAFTTTCEGGYSKAPYASNNLALHVGDEEVHVLKNRAALMRTHALPNEPAWLEQTHSTRCVVVETDTNRIADASITRVQQQPLAIMTADCLPILLCNREGNEIAAIHAGWRGLLNGVVENTLKKMQTPSANLLAWIGPAICQQCYKTSSEVKEAYLKQYPFTTSAFDNLHANLPKLAELILNSAGVLSIFQSNACTFELSNMFYSYRRQSQTGRIATLIWFNEG
jgi:YfiH family protein